MSGNEITGYDAVTLLRPIANAAQIMKLHEEISAFIKDALVEGRDYGVIPGTKNKTLLKPGAERLCFGFGLAVKYEIVEHELDPKRENTYTTRNNATAVSYGYCSYVIEAILIDRRSGEIVGRGLGSCSTAESKYVSRPDDLDNTILKMAQKRAFVGAVVATFALSDQFAESSAAEAAAEEEPPPFPPEVMRAPNFDAFNVQEIIKWLVYVCGVSKETVTAFQDECKTEEVSWSKTAREALKAAKGEMTDESLLASIPLKAVSTPPIGANGPESPNEAPIGDGGREEADPEASQDVPPWTDFVASANALGFVNMEEEIQVIQILIELGVLTAHCRMADVERRSWSIGLDRLGEVGLGVLDRPPHADTEYNPFEDE